MALGPVKPHVKAAADAIAAQFGIKTMYGWRPADPFPDHPSGLAVDFMINDLPNGKAVGDALANYVIQNATALNVKYLIWYRRSWNATRKTWEPYNQPGQPPHTDHVHVTWNAVGGSDISNLIPVSSGSDSLSQLTDVFGQVSNMLTWFTDPDKKMRVRLVLIGGMLVAFGLLKFDKIGRVAATVVGKTTGKIAGVVKNGGS